MIRRNNARTSCAKTAGAPRVFLSGLCVLFFGSFVGCGSSESAQYLPVFPAAGTVQVDGKPPVGAFLVLHPKAGFQRGPDGELVRPHGVVGEDGSFQLTSYQTNDGAPVGEYIVTFELRKVLKYAGGDAGPGPNLIPAQYTKVGTSPVVVKIEATRNHLPSISLTAARPNKQSTASRNSPSAARSL
jgi:hypothetical protein